MLDTEVYTEKLLIFGRLLRQEGLDVSPKENADALSILLEFELDDREKVKTALRTVYAKSRDEQNKFDRVFDSFFISEDKIRALDRKHQKEELEKRKALEEAEKRLSEQGNESDFTEEQIEAYSQLSEEEKRRLENLKSRFEGSTDRSAPLYAEFIRSVFMKSILEQQIKMEDAAMGVQAIDPEIGLLFKDISKFEDNEIPKAVTYIRELAAQINGELTKKNSGRGRSDAIDFKKTIRKGLETGGSLYRLKYKKPKRRRKTLVILCDVSGSMIQFSEFALRFIQALNNASDGSRVFLFSEDSVEADKFSLRNLDLFRSYVKDSGVYGRGTNLGLALKKINDERPSVISSSTALIILSDVKSMDMGLALSELDRARARAGKVFCLNPIPANMWKYSSSIMSVSEKCTMISCSTLSELGEACRRISRM